MPTGGRSNILVWEREKYSSNGTFKKKFCVCVSFSSVNGNGTAHAGYKSEETGPASTASLTTVKESKPKASFLPM